MRCRSLKLALNKCRKELGGSFPAKASFFFGIGPSKAWDRFAKLLFDWFRAPSLEVSIRDSMEWASIRKIGFLPVIRLEGEEKKRFLASMDTYTSREWRDSKARTPARYTFATLVDPHEALPPSEISSLRYWAKIAEKMGVEVEPITKKDLAKLANYDALFIRETTSISNHTYRFARRAQQEGMPVIDDPLSMIRCTNKVYLNELMAYNKVPVPPTVMIASQADFELAADTLGFPLVLKIPDSSFSRGVKKVSSLEELKKLATMWLEDSDLLIAQKFLPTEYDWRVGVLGGQPLFAVHYLMVKKHWQIVNHDRAGKPQQGGIKTFTLKEAPPLVVETAVKRCPLHRRRALRRRPQGDQGRRLHHRGERQSQPRPRLGGFGREGRSLDPTHPVVSGPSRPPGTLVRRRFPYSKYTEARRKLATMWPYRYRSTGNA